MLSSDHFPHKLFPPKLTCWKIYRQIHQRLMPRFHAPMKSTCLLHGGPPQSPLKRKLQTWPAPGGPIPKHESRSGHFMNGFLGPGHKALLQLFACPIDVTTPGFYPLKGPQATNFSEIFPAGACNAPRHLLPRKKPFVLSPPPL